MSDPVMRQKLPKNARGGNKIVGLHASRDPIGEDIKAEVYGASTQCPDDSCLHRLTVHQWHPRLKRKRRAK